MVSWFAFLGLIGQSSADVELPHTGWPSCQPSAPSLPTVTLVACLAALSLLPIYKPAAWVAHRNLLAMLAMLNVTLVGAFCV